MRLAWAAKVSSEFARKAIAIANELGSDPNHFMACMAFESGETFSPSIVNHVSGATGLIQFMRPTARSLGTTTTALAGMSAEDQLDYVRAYFKPYRGKLKTLDDFYMAILWPAAVGKPSSYVLFDGSKDKTRKAYSQNKGLDANKDGLVTKSEAAAQPRLKLAKGLKAPYVGEVDTGDDDVGLPIPVPRERPATAPQTGADGEPDTKFIQTSLLAMNYATGRIDGLPGGKLFGAITAFLTDWNERDGDITPPKNNDDYYDIADDLTKEIHYALAEGFKRPVTKERAEAKPEVVEEIAPEAKTQKRGILATAWAAIVAFFGGLMQTFGGYLSSAWNWITGNKDQLPEAVTDPGWLQWGFGKIAALPPAFWLFIGAGVLAFVSVGLIRTLRQTVDDVRTGKR